MKYIQGSGATVNICIGYSNFLCWLWNIYEGVELPSVQWRSQNAHKATHIKRRLLDKAVILFNRLPFQNRNIS